MTVYHRRARGVPSGYGRRPAPSQRGAHSGRDRCRGRARDRRARSGRRGDRAVQRPRAAARRPDPGSRAARRCPAWPSSSTPATCRRSPSCWRWTTAARCRSPRPGAPGAHKLVVTTTRLSASRAVASRHGKPALPRPRRDPVGDQRRLRALPARARGRRRDRRLLRRPPSHCWECSRAIPKLFGDARLAQQIEAGHMPPLEELLEAATDPPAA